MKTVSRVVNNEPNVAEETRRQVLRVIVDMGYVPHLQAQRLASGRTRCPGFARCQRSSTGAATCWTVTREHCSRSFRCSVVAGRWMPRSHLRSRSGRHSGPAQPARRQIAGGDRTGAGWNRSLSHAGDAAPVRS
ncbi:MAG: LacI family DNA-binding transcriptional regulator [Chloroflexi bacterium]|nr:LacI family DNA-binding transcriptional regulator [Chloroflexota bacterium]